MVWSGKLTCPNSKPSLQCYEGHSDLHKEERIAYTKFCWSRIALILIIPFFNLILFRKTMQLSRGTSIDIKICRQNANHPNYPLEIPPWTRRSRIFDYNTCLGCLIPQLQLDLISRTFSSKSDAFVFPHQLSVSPQN